MPAWHNLAHPRRIPSYLSTWQDDGEEVTWRNYKGELTDNQRKLQEKIQKRLQKVTRGCHCILQMASIALSKLCSLRAQHSLLG